jgi:hypothetical protein
VTLLVDTYDTGHGVHLAAEILAAINDEAHRDPARQR